MPVTEIDTPCPELTFTLVTCKVIVFRASLIAKYEPCMLIVLPTSGYTAHQATQKLFLLALILASYGNNLQQNIKTLSSNTAIMTVSSVQ